jgi:hypothetical protein
MDSDIVVSLVGLAGVAVGAILGIAATHLKLGKEHKLAYDRDLRDKRLPHYQGLYHALAILPRESKPGEEPSRSDLAQMRETLHEWYFGEEAGGLFLTTDARKTYFDLQDRLKVLGEPTGGGESQTLSPSDREALYLLASGLRHQMIADLGTAMPPLLTWDRPGETPKPPKRALRG